MAEIDDQFNQTVNFLYTQLPMFQRDGASAFKKDLSNTKRLCAFLNEPHHQFKSIHIAGTNGKGSSAHFLAAIFQAEGYKTGLYTSPHLKSFTERIRINGVEIPKEEVVNFVNLIKPLMAEIKPSFFEITVALSFYYFAKENVDMAIIEVGMGGRLDSTNVILPEVSLITNIGWDHQQWLGDTLEAIASEKAGIIKEHIPVVIGEHNISTFPVFNAVAKKHHAEIYLSEKLVNINGTIAKTDEFEINLPTDWPDYQYINIRGVLAIITLMNKRGFEISQSAAEKGIHSVYQTGLKGRWQIISKNPYVICDTGHNEDGIYQVLVQLKKLTYSKLHFVLGTVNDKDIDKILKLLPKEANYYFCQAKIPRALDANELQKKALKNELKGMVIPDVNEAIDAAKRNALTDDLIFIGGSNFVVAEIADL